MRLGLYGWIGFACICGFRCTLNLLFLVFFLGRACKTRTWVDTMLRVGKCMCVVSVCPISSHSVALMYYAVYLLPVVIHSRRTNTQL